VGSGDRRVPPSREPKRRRANSVVKEDSEDDDADHTSESPSELAKRQRDEDELAIVLEAGVGFIVGALSGDEENPIVLD
jgi:hypothetical protein